MTKTTNFIGNLKRTWPYFKGCKQNLIAYALISILESITSALIPIVGAKVILNLTSGIIKQLIMAAFLVFILQLVLSVIFYLKNHFFLKISLKTLNSLQMAVAEEMLKLEIAEIDKTSSGLFIDRLNRDTEEISVMFMEYTYWLSHIISNMGVLLAIFILNHYLFIFSISMSLILFVINKIKMNKIYKVQERMKKLQEKKTSLTGELVRGIRDIKVLNAKQTILKQIENKIIEVSQEEEQKVKERTKYTYLENNFKAISDFSFILLGCYLLGKNLLTIPSFVIIYNYQGRIKTLLIGLTEILEYNKKFVLSSNRIFEIIHNTTFQKEKFGTEHQDKLSGSIKFHQVTFGYQKDQNIINNMNFEIKPNETVAFVGKSGVGKTTIFNLLTKLYEVQEGQIFLDNTDIKQLDCDTIRNNMSIITQSSYIFNFSIKENLLLAKPDATMEEVRAACQMACIDDFIMSLENGYDTMIGENGIILSGGQRQRIAIARALLMKTEIILFDEATSALDNETQSEIKKAIQNMQGEYTILIIAHRLSTIMESDRIFVIDQGSVIASGTHQELLKTCDFYKSLYEKDLQATIELS